MTYQQAQEKMEKKIAFIDSIDWDGTIVLYINGEDVTIKADFDLTGEV